MTGHFFTKCHPAHQELIAHIYATLNSHREQFGFQFLDQGHFIIQTKGVGDQTTDSLKSRLPTLPHELQWLIYFFFSLLTNAEFR